MTDNNMKMRIKTLGKKQNEAIVYNKGDGGYTIGKGDIKRVYCDLSKFMVSIGEISIETMRKIKYDLFDAEK